MEKIGDILWLINANISWWRCIKITGFISLVWIILLLSEIVADEFYTLSVIFFVVILLIGMFSEDPLKKNLTKLLKKERKQ